MLFLFFFNDTATTEIYTLSLHDALPICGRGSRLSAGPGGLPDDRAGAGADELHRDRKSTRLNSSHRTISYAVFCLKKKKKKTTTSSRLPRSSAESTKVDTSRIEYYLNTP